MNLPGPATVFTITTKEAATHFWSVKDIFRCKKLSVLSLLIGASLSEPHTSVTALSTCVCIYLTMLVTVTANEHIQNFTMSTWACTSAKREGLLADGRVGVK